MNREVPYLLGAAWGGSFGVEEHHDGLFALVSGQRHGASLAALENPAYGERGSVGKPLKGHGWSAGRSSLGWPSQQNSCTGFLHTPIELSYNMKGAGRGDANPEPG